ncbi:MAG: hypothetical protein JWL84_3867 [Rhodospirillales bacterium]|jgi:hypothetical protein|nr:hypothetical protein [Rhodospirillales bacterium]
MRRPAKSDARPTPTSRRSEVVASAAAAPDEPAAAIAVGLQEVGAELAAYAEQTLDQAVNLARSLIDVGSLAQVIALQQNFAQAILATLIAGSARVTEISLRTGELLIGGADLPHDAAPRDGAG